jgi:hypothetical protein
MTNAQGTRGREPFKDTGGRDKAEPLFPSEGTFSAVVPLSQVRDGRVSARDSAANAAPEAIEEEMTLVPSRVSPATRARRASASLRDGKTKTRGGRHWLATAAAVLLSVSAGVAAGAYMVWTRQTQQTRPPVTQTADAAAPSQPAPEVAPAEPTQVAAEASAPSAEVVKVERSERVETPAEVGKPEPPSRREAETERRASEVETRAARRARANVETVEASPAPKPRREEATPRRQATPAKPNASAAAGRALPVSSPPPSAKSRTVIQWP